MLVSPSRHVCATKLTLPLITSHGVPKQSQSCTGAKTSCTRKPCAVAGFFDSLLSDHASKLFRENRHLIDGEEFINGFLDA